jgi:hypothetical protein
LVVSIKIFGIRDRGGLDLIGMGKSFEQVSVFSHALNEQLANYQRGLITDNAPMADGLPIWVVYNHPRDWPSFYVARLFINDKPRGNMLLYREIEPLRDELTERGLIPMMRAESDDPVILETWL